MCKFRRSPTNIIQQCRNVTDGIKERLGSRLFYIILSAICVVLVICIVSIIVATTRKRDISEEGEEMDTTTRRSTTKLTTTTMATAHPDIYCAFAVDLLTFNNNSEIMKETEMVSDIAQKVVNTSLSSSAGFWAYGQVNQNIASKKFYTVFENMANDSSIIFEKAYREILPGDFPCPPADESAIDHINRSRDVRNVANCLLFFSGIKEPEPWWQIQPIYNYKSIVLVSLRGVDLADNIGDRGVALKIPFDNYSYKDVDIVYNAIKSRFGM
ncbi:unnamed protein product [Cylicocyclus nassatus]|uniref:Uncharacterized protein n=1 Tax=Cylicocyclus nassatus TaxID=53992 RepID=A0AA36H731_CYLNA|nr:unnamed protein product [Cylicocyclus nassatus]